MPTKFLRLEGFVVFAISVMLYFFAGNGWIWFVVLLFVPDISMVGYLKNPKIGAWVYNLGHSYILALILLALAQYYSFTFLFSISLIWLAHIGVDRVLGFGLKYETGFKDTHLGRIGN